MDKDIKKEYLRGVSAGVPIGLGYLSVSFTFGIIAITMGYTWWQATLISFLTVTSAGQFSGIKTMLSPGHFVEMIVSQLTINVRYSFMSISAGQKAAESFRGIKRWLLGFFMTDEIFAVAVREDVINTAFFSGLATIPWFGWTFGTFAGAVFGNILPEKLLSAMGVALYGMFVAIVVPEMKKVKAVMYVVFAAVALSCLFYYAPYLKEIPAGFAVSICAVVAAVVGAIFFPVREEDSNELEDKDLSAAEISEKEVG